MNHDYLGKITNKGMCIFNRSKPRRCMVGPSSFMAIIRQERSLLQRAQRGFPMQYGSS